MEDALVCLSVVTSGGLKHLLDRWGHSVACSLYRRFRPTWSRIFARCFGTTQHSANARHSDALPGQKYEGGCGELGYRRDVSAIM